MTTRLSQFDIDSAGMRAGGAYNNPHKEIGPDGKPLQPALQPSPPTLAGTRSLRLQMFDYIAEAARRANIHYGGGTPTPMPGQTLQQMSSDRFIQMFGHVANLYMIGNEHTAGQAGDERKAALAELQALDALAGGAPYRAPAARPTRAPDDAEHPRRCAFCGGGVVWRDVHVMSEFLATPGARIDGLSADLGDVAHVGCWVPRSEVT